MEERADDESTDQSDDSQADRAGRWLFADLSREANAVGGHVGGSAGRAEPEDGVADEAAVPTSAPGGSDLGRATGPHALDDEAGYEHHREETRCAPSTPAL